MSVAVTHAPLDGAGVIAGLDDGDEFIKTGA
jgi:hypothetical protein